MVCPNCSENLVACIGTKRKPYFRHLPKSEKHCNYNSYCESIIHRLAKDILMRSHYIRLPEAYFQCGNSQKYVVEQEKYVFMQYIDKEKAIGSIKPDIIIDLESGQKLFIEIYVSHKIDDKKLTEIKHLGINVIQIDLSKLKIQEDTLEKDLETILLKDISHKEWIYNREMEEYKLKFISRDHFKTKPSTFDNNKLVMDCPLKKRGETHTLNTYSYVTDCEKCPHFCEFTPEYWVRCRCESSINSLDELDMPIADFKNQSEERLDGFREQQKLGIKRKIDNLVCPSCEGKLVSVSTSSGIKLFCENRKMSPEELASRVIESTGTCKDCNSMIEEAILPTSERITFVKEVCKGKLCTKHKDITSVKINEHEAKSEVFLVRKNAICGFYVSIDEAGNKAYPERIKH